jgi:hypothetical protein
MDPITAAILASAAAGVVSGASEVGKQVVVDAYQALKAAIQRKYGAESKLAAAVEAVEDEPEFEPNRQALAGRVKQTDADEDPELSSLAEELLVALEETKQGKQALRKYDIQVSGGQVGVIGDHAQIEGGIHFGDEEDA